jgi:hypothetical protein
MSSRIYANMPNRAYWREVAELDRTLSDRGSVVTGGLVGMLTLNTRTEWRRGENDYGLMSARFMGIHIGSVLLQVTELSASGTRSLDLGRVALVRRVPFIASGVYASGNHGVSDHQFILNGLDLGRFERGEIEVGSAEFRALRSTMKKAKREQNASGFSIPTEETYTFILETLRQGVEATGGMPGGEIGS